MVWVQIPSREEQKFDCSKNLILTLFGLIYIYRYRKDNKDKPRNCVLLCVKSLKACIRRMIENKLSCKLSKRMYYCTRKRGNHFYQCSMQFYIILIHKFVVSRSFKIRFCSDLSDYRSFELLTLQTIDPSD